jgi:hypothetical protein
MKLVQANVVPSESNPTISVKRNDFFIYNVIINDEFVFTKIGCKGRKKIGYFPIFIIFATDFMVKDFLWNLVREAGENPAQYPLL